MNDEMKRVLDKALNDEYEKGFLQGVWEFLHQLQETHKLPDEIANDLIHKND